MSFFKDFKADFTQAMNELMPDSNEVYDEDLVEEPSSNEEVVEDDIQELLDSITSPKSDKASKTKAKKEKTPRFKKKAKEEKISEDIPVMDESSLEVVDSNSTVEEVNIPVEQASVTQNDIFSQNQEDNTDLDELLNSLNTPIIPEEQSDNNIDNLEIAPEDMLDQVDAMLENELYGTPEQATPVIQDDIDVNTMDMSVEDLLKQLENNVAEEQNDLNESIQSMLNDTDEVSNEAITETVESSNVSEENSEMSIEELLQSLEEEVAVGDTPETVPEMVVEDSLEPTEEVEGEDVPETVEDVAVEDIPDTVEDVAVEDVPEPIEEVAVEDIPEIAEEVVVEDIPELEDEVEVEDLPEDIEEVEVEDLTQPTEDMEEVKDLLENLSTEEFDADDSAEVTVKLSEEDVAKIESYNNQTQEQIATEEIVEEVEDVEELSSIEDVKEEESSIVNMEDVHMSDEKDVISIKAVEEKVVKPVEEKTYGVDEADSETTYITKGTKISGNLETDGSIDIIGTVDGDVSCKGKVVVGGSIKGAVTAGELYCNSARIEGDIKSYGSVKVGVGSMIIGNVVGESAVIAGAVNGDIDVKGPVIVDSTAVIMGNIKSRSVQINNGAVIEGFCSQSYSDIDVKSFFA